MLSRQKNRRTATAPSDDGNDNHNNHDNEGEEIEYGTSLNHPPLIYSAPTVDTLGDESTSIRPYATTMRGPKAQSPPVATTAATTVTTTTGTGATTTTSTKRANHPPGPSTSQQRRTQRGPASSTGTAPHNHPRKKSSRDSRPPPEFQRVEDCMSLSIRKIPVAERSAFWGGGNYHRKEHHHHHPAASPSAPLMEDIFNKGPQWKKVSPSPQHLYWIHKLQGMDSIRQLAFSPSMGASSDVLYHCLKDDNDEAKKSTKRRSPSTGAAALGATSDGRYRSIDPVQATLSELPIHPPLLSNKRHRLPMRADVGFPNATLEEIRLKQQEISQESEWEEASPRLVVLVTSDDLGMAAMDPSSSYSSSTSSNNNKNDNFLTGSLVANMPYAGKELIAAKWRNQQQHILSKQKGLVLTTASKARVPSPLSSSPSSLSLPPPPPRPPIPPELMANRYSILAPPLDASYSSTQGWKPRPFHDRPPGMRYTLVSPIHLELGIGRSIEPLVCSLTLYTLDDGRGSSSSGNDRRMVGKTSEDFYFPAGNWNGKMQLGDSLLHQPPQSSSQSDSQVNPQKTTEQSWLNRKHKAMFALDPLVAPKEQLYVVLKVFTVTHLELAAAYLMTNTKGASGSTDHHDYSSTTEGGGGDSQQPPQDRASWRRRLKKQHQKSKTPEACIQRASYRASVTFDAFGTQFLSPLCFGVTPLHKQEQQLGETPLDYVWPVGQVHDEMALYAFPSTPESQDDFVQRLHTIVFPQMKDFSQSPSGLSLTGAQPTSSTINVVETPQKRKGLARFMSPKKTPKKDMDEVSEISTTTATTSSRAKTKMESTMPIHGKVSLYISDMDVDFLEAVLNTPADLEDKPSDDRAPEGNGRVLPKLLADVSGMCGIMMDPTAKGVNATKRSNLVRLPPNGNGYMDVADFREVWFLPPKPPKLHHVDQPPSYGSLVNLLYIYPRMLRLSSGADKSLRRSSKNSPTYYTVGVSLVDSVADTHESGIIEAQTIRLKNFHNPAPWAGPSFVKSVYTKLVGDGILSDDLKAGLPLQDEFKMQLPAVLDGNQFLRFTLCLVDLSDDLDDASIADNISSEENRSITVKRLVETTIPLSSYASRDPAFGTKVTTVIPNGTHRLKLGDFQLQVETRLLSSIHVADPSLATALREFPVSIANESTAYGATELAMISKDKSSPSEKVVFRALFALADPSSLLCHFRTLLFMHLASLLRDKQNSNMVSEKFLSDCMDSLLEVCNRTRGAIMQNDDKNHVRLQAFIKAVVDAYDEAYVHSSNIDDAEVDDDAASEVARVESADSGRGQQEEEDPQELDGGAIRRRKKDAFRHEIDTRISRTFSAMESPSSTTFLRTAYGATKTDRMRLEAELGATTSRYTHLVDDDETVVTFATGYSGEARMVEAREAFERVKSPRAKDLAKGSGVVSHGTSATPTQEFSYKSLSETVLAQRVRSAAKVMLAPCVPPSFFGPSPKTENGSQEEKIAVRGSTLEPVQEDSVCDDDRVVALAGSDVEDEGQSQNETGVISRSLEGEVAFRSPYNCIVLPFSVKFETSDPNAFIPLVRAEYVYESLLLLWLRSISDFAASKGFSRGSRLILTTSSTNDESDDNSFQNFYDNMDLLLPLCLKSLALRFGFATKTSTSSMVRVIIDKEHIAVFESFFETVPLLLLREAMSGPQSPHKDSFLQNVLTKSELIIDFLIALYAIFHPVHTAVLTQKLFQSLRYAETEGFDIENGDIAFEWTDENLYRVKCSRQLRLRAVERLAVLPNFIALNYPMRFPTRKLPPRVKGASWKAQHRESCTETPLKAHDLLSEDEKGYPPSGWLAEILTKEALSISALSCEAVVAEALAHAEEHKAKSPSRASALQRPTAALTREDLLMFQSIAIHGITCVHELLLRRHAMDKRFQKNSTRARIASLFALSIFEKSLASVRWLARMESTHRVRSLWLLCFTYILQEAPENLLREAVNSFNTSREIQIHRFVRLLRLGSSTFQSFVDQPRYCMFPTEIDSSISPWLLQESFNTICATTIIVVEECAGPKSTDPTDQKKLIQGVLDLLLHILTTPQSTVTHLRAVGGAIQALEGFGAAMFMETTGSSLQHWIRVILGLMNSIALSVRSIAVDFVVSLLGGSFDLYGSIDEVAIIFATVLPEVAAREIGLCSVSGHITSLDDVERAVWPLRRSFADLEDANPVDDDRVDTQLSPVLSVFSRACQAVLDGVLIELRLEGKTCDIVGSTVKLNPLETYAFDADEESLFEAANFFLPESAPIQRIRWFLTLKTLHTAKGQWVEAAESLVLSARAIADSIPHLNSVWRPSRFPLWSDFRRSLWLSTVGEDLGIPERGNDQVMSFAEKFLEPAMFELLDGATVESGKSKQPSVPLMCSTLTKLTRDAVAMYEREGGLDQLAYSRLESLLIILMGVLDDHASRVIHPITKLARVGILDRRRHVEDEAALRKVIASISGYMTKLAERMLLVDNPSTFSPRSRIGTRKHFFVRLLLSGRKPNRFTESTTLPAFLEWGTPCICRVPRALVDKALQTAARMPDRLEEIMCSAFAKPIRTALIRHNVAQSSIVFRLGNQSQSESDDGNMVYVDLGFVQITTGLGTERGFALGGDHAVVLGSSAHTRDDVIDDTNTLPSKHFMYRKPPGASQLISSTFVEVTVASPFPCPLSRQRSLLTSEFGSKMQ